MKNILLKIENDAAEKLWNYILAYKELRRRGKEGSEKETQEDNISFIVPERLEQIKNVAKGNKA